MLGIVTFKIQCLICEDIPSCNLRAQVLSCHLVLSQFAPGIVEDHKYISRQVIYLQYTPHRRDKECTENERRERATATPRIGPYDRCIHSTGRSERSHAMCEIRSSDQSLTKGSDYGSLLVLSFLFYLMEALKKAFEDRKAKGCSFSYCNLSMLIPQLLGLRCSYTFRHCWLSYQRRHLVYPASNAIWRGRYN